MAAQPEVKAAYWPIFRRAAGGAKATTGVGSQATVRSHKEVPPGEAAVVTARERAAAIAQRYDSLYPAAVVCVTDDLNSLTTFPHFPVEDRERIRHTNLLERTFGETRRRVKVIGRLPGERTCLALVWAVLDRASKGWRGLQRSSAGMRRLQDLRRQPSPTVSASIGMNEAA